MLWLLSPLKDFPAKFNRFSRANSGIFEPTTCIQDLSAEALERSLCREGTAQHSYQPTDRLTDETREGREDITTQNQGAAEIESFYSYYHWPTTTTTTRWSCCVVVLPACVRIRGLRFGSRSVLGYQE